MNYESDLPDLSELLLARELEARAAKVDPALCNGLGMMYADRAVLCEAARRLYEEEKDYHVHHEPCCAGPKRYGDQDCAVQAYLWAAIERCRNRQPLADPLLPPEGR